MSTDQNTTNAPSTATVGAAGDRTAANLWTGLLAGIGAVMGFSALFYKPLMMGSIAVVFIVLGSLGNGQPSKISKVAMPMALACFFLGMVLSIFVTEKALW